MNEKEYSERQYRENVKKAALIQISKIVGEFTIETIIKDSPGMIWGQTKDYAGITEDFFKKYFKGKNKAYAIEIKRCIQYQRPIELNKIGVKRAPQSFMYLK